MAILTCSTKPVFIVGSARSGTTWLQSIIASHPSFFSVPETKYFQNLLDPNKIMTFYERYPSRRKPIPLKVKHVDMLLHHMSSSKGCNLEKDTKAIITKFADNDGIDHCFLLNYIIYNCFSNAQENLGKHWVEKTPKHIFFLEDIFKHFPHAKVICIRRDFDEIALSSFNVFGYPILAGYRDAKKSYISFEKFIQQNKNYRERIFELNYQDLKSNPIVIKDIFAFIGFHVPDHNRLLEQANHTFDSIYQATNMATVQPRMKENNEFPKTEIEKEFAKILIKICRPLSKDIEPIDRTYLFSLKFWQFFGKHTWHYMKFAIATFLKTMIIKLFRAVNSRLLQFIIQTKKQIVDRNV